MGLLLHRIASVSEIRLYVRDESIPDLYILS